MWTDGGGIFRFGLLYSQDGERALPADAPHVPVPLEGLHEVVAHLCVHIACINK